MSAQMGVAATCELVKEACNDLQSCLAYCPATSLDAPVLLALLHNHGQAGFPTSCATSFHLAKGTPVTIGYATIGMAEHSRLHPWTLAAKRGRLM